MLNPLAVMQAFSDELVKIKKASADDLIREGINVAKKLKANGAYKNLRGNALKDYMYHMDMSAHPKFRTGVKTTVQGMGKSAAGKLPPALSMGGLAGLVGLEGSQAFNKEKSKKERMMSAGAAGATGSILAGEAIHNKKLIKSTAKSGLKKLKGLASKAGKTVLKHASVEKVSMDLWNPATGKIFGEAASKAKSIATGAAKAAPKAKVDGKAMLAQIKNMKRTGQTGTIGASTFGKAASMDKEAFLSKLLGKSVAQAKKVAPMKPSFQGHAKALGVGAKTNAKGVTTSRSFDSLSKNVNQKKYIEIPGLT